MTKIFLLILLLVLFSIALIFLIFRNPTATINNHQFAIDIAVSSKEQEIGLAKYQSLPMNKGMYFPFSHPDYYAFWMKNMRFPIDIIYLNNNKIVTIIHNAPAPDQNEPDTLLPIYRPTDPANAVLEINANLATKYGLKTGDTVTITM